MTPAHLHLAIVREEALANFYRAERDLGTPPLEANLLMAEFAKRFDADQSPFEREQEAVAKIMEYSR